MFLSSLKITWSGEPSLPHLYLFLLSLEPNKTTANQHGILPFLLLYSMILMLEYLWVEPEEPEEGGGGGRLGLLRE